MKRLTVSYQELNRSDLSGAVLCRDLNLMVDGRRSVLRRGATLDQLRERLTEADSPDDAVIHLLVPGSDDIDQERASVMLASAITGIGLAETEPHQGQVDLRATTPGLLRVSPAAIAALNRAEVALVATALDGRVVEPDETVAIVKASELLVDSLALEGIIARHVDQPAIAVHPFQRCRVGLIAGERIRQANLEVSARHLGAGLARFGAELVDVRRSPDDPDQIAATYREMINAGVELILVAGSIVLDPQDPYLLAVEQVGGRLVRRGAPIDPGTMFWVAYLEDDVPVFGLASCEMYGRLSIFDLFLPYALADQRIDSELMSELGYGGLLDDTQIARRPASWRTAQDSD